MFHNAFRFLFSMALLLLLSGCWDSIDIENRALIISLAIDIAEKENDSEERNITHLQGDNRNDDSELIELTAQIDVPGRVPLSPTSGGGETEKSPVWVVSAIGHTMDDALINLQQEIASQLYYGHLQMIIVSEEFAKNGVQRLNDFLHRESEVRRTAWLVVSKDKAADYMKLDAKLERLPGIYIKNMLDRSVDFGRLPADYIGSFWRITASKGQDGYLPYVELKGNDKVRISGLAYFKGDQMLGAIDPIEIGLFMEFIGVGEGGYGIYIDIPDQAGTVLLMGRKRITDIQTAVRNGKPEARVNIMIEADIDEKNSDAKLDDSNIIRRIAKHASTQMAKSQEELVKKMQAEESDIFGFGEYVRAKQPAYWKKEVRTKDRWRPIFKEMDVHVEVNVFVRKVGMKQK